MNAGRKQFPHADWFWKDGMHPGSELVLLESVLLYRQFYGVLPAAQALVVDAPMYVPGSKFSAPSPISIALPSKSVEQRATYPRESVEGTIALARGVTR